MTRLLTSLLLVAMMACCADAYYSKSRSASRGNYYKSKYGSKYGGSSSGKTSRSSRYRKSKSRSKSKSKSSNKSKSKESWTSRWNKMKKAYKKKYGSKYGGSGGEENNNNNNNNNRNKNKNNKHKEKCQTAWVKGEVPMCFSSMKGCSKNGEWGWTNRIGAGTESLELWAGAEKCETGRGELTGGAVVEVSDAGMQVTLETNRGWRMEEAAMWIGSDKLPAQSYGEYSASVEKFPYKTSREGLHRFRFRKGAMPASLYIAMHVEVCEVEEEEKEKEERTPAPGRPTPTPSPEEEGPEPEEECGGVGAGQEGTVLPWDAQLRAPERVFRDRVDELCVARERDLRGCERGGEVQRGARGLHGGRGGAGAGAGHGGRDDRPGGRVGCGGGVDVDWAHEAAAAPLRAVQRPPGTLPVQDLA